MHTPPEILTIWRLTIVLYGIEDCWILQVRYVRMCTHMIQSDNLLLVRRDSLVFKRRLGVMSLPWENSRHRVVGHQSLLDV